MAIKFETFDMPKSESTLDEEQEKVEAWKNSHIRRA